MHDVRDIPVSQLPWPLLLEADPYRPHVESYVHRAVWLGLHAHRQLLAVAALVRCDPHTVELMNIAVEPAQRRRGLGTYLVRLASERARLMGAGKLVLGTGNSSFDALAFYQRMGFRMEEIDRDHFVREYPEPIVENGIVCREMVRLGLTLKALA